VASWSFLTNHARVLLCIARDPGVRLRDLAASLGITERSAHGIVTDLAGAGYVLKQKDGRRNRYQIQAGAGSTRDTSDRRHATRRLGTQRVTRRHQTPTWQDPP
jgi:DNA-binding IclR family transcriptional regulator